jgi:tRNA (adenine57-N1/adenine58-N1)-methyltransferase
VEVIEAGTGSGALTLLLAMLVGEAGRVYSYERKAATQALARENAAKIGLGHRVNFIEADIRRGFQQKNVHALFLDVDTPWEYLPQAAAALRGGGFFGARVNTLNQVQQTLQALEHAPWMLVQVEELLLREWQPYPAQLRPQEQMAGHTGFLIFARTTVPPNTPLSGPEAAAWEE